MSHSPLDRLVGTFTTPWGEGMVTVSHGRLAGVELPPFAGPAITEPTRSADHQNDVALAQWVAQLEAYFRGERLAWTPEEVPLEALGGGSFYRAVYETLLVVPPAVTVSYGTLAEMAGYPRAARAVGTAMAINPIPIVIPCHRVVRADGSLGNYGTDPAWKERLLSHEAEHIHPRVPEG
ncbi:MAG: methylated-DNA--[protein]-cysteine S-methyltransferase [Thermoleophilia bacterium]|nr:methylated-DNA--[protein]-cysteine S-methyltransferase [Thermoleophilia bacterium]